MGKKTTGHLTAKSENMEESIREVRDAFVAAFVGAPAPIPSAMPMDCWVREVWDDAVIVEMGQENWRAPYTRGADGKIMFAPREQWETVEQTWKPATGKSLTTEDLTALGGEVKALGDGKLGGYLVVFGDEEHPDRSVWKDFFNKDTDFEVDNWEGAHVGVRYHHGLDATLGQKRLSVGEIGLDDVGVWIKTQLAMRDAYEKALYEFAKAGKVDWSSGTASHLVGRKAIGDKGVHQITRWPLGLDASLTPLPAEPRARVVALKSLGTIEALAEAESALKAFLPQVDGESAAGASKGKVEAPNIETKTEVETIMDEKEIKTLVADAAKAAATEAVEAFKASLPPVTGGLSVTKDESENGFKSFGEQLRAIKMAALQPGNVDPRLLAINDKAMKATGASETVGSEGGFLVQQDFAKEQLGRIYNTGAILSRVKQRPIGANANGLVINVINETDRATGSRFGGVRAYWLNEGGTLTKSKPAYRRFSLNLEKLIGLYYATDELLQDETALGGEVGDSFSQELQFAAEDAIVNGLGAGTPLGVLVSDATVSVTKETGQAAATVVAENISKMWARMWAPDRANAVWFINQEIEPQLDKLSIPVGTGGIPVYMPANGLSGQPFSTLKGRPVIPVEYCAALGTVGDIILANFANYRWIDKAGIQTASSIHVQFVTDEMTFRWVWRCNGAPFDAAPLTPYKGSGTLGHFVTVATRA